MERQRRDHDVEQLHVDWTRCNGRGLCTELLGELLTEDDWGYPVSTTGAVGPSPHSGGTALHQEPGGRCPQARHEPQTCGHAAADLEPLMVETLSTSALLERRGATTALVPPSASAPRRSRRDLLALVRFVLAGCAGNVVYSLVFLALAQSGDSVTVPSVIASVVSTVAVNEAHRLWTFRSIGRPSVLQAHLSGAASALVGTGLTAVVLLVWTWLFPDASLMTDVALSWCVTALVGAGNFLHLRRFSTANAATSGSAV